MIDKNQTEIFRIGLASGLIDIDDIIHWADGKIEAGNDDYSFIEISTARNINNLIFILRRIEGTVDLKIVIHGYFSILCHHYKKFPNSHRQITRTLYWIMREYNDNLSNDEIGMIYYLDEAYDLAVQGTYGTLETYKQELKEFLSKYEGAYKSIFL